MRIRYRDGSWAYAWILSLAGGVMRVAVKDGGDALELKFEDGEWVAEDGRTATFEFPSGPDGVSGFLASMEQMIAAGDPYTPQA